jgi:antitoxin component of MazEF toxin-antitoxin module
MSCTISTMKLWCNRMHTTNRIKVSVRKWGNSLAVRIPRKVVKEFQVRQDQELEMEVTANGEELVLRVRKKLPLNQT